MDRVTIGKKIKRLRKSLGLTQEDLAERADLTKGFISQLERGLTSISVESLIQVLNALDTDITEFFKEEGPEKVVYTTKDRVVKEENGVTVSYLVPGSQNWIMDPVLLKVKPGKYAFKHNSHTGEGFGYVLQGKFLLTIEKNKYTLGKNDCFYYDSDRPHSLKNIGNVVGVILCIEAENY